MKGNSFNYFYLFKISYSNRASSFTRLLILMHSSCQRILGPFPERLLWLKSHQHLRIYDPPFVSINAIEQLPIKLTPTKFSSWHARFITVLIGYDSLGYMDGRLHCPSKAMQAKQLRACLASNSPTPSSPFCPSATVLARDTSVKVPCHAQFESPFSRRFFVPPAQHIFSLFNMHLVFSPTLQPSGFLLHAINPPPHRHAISPLFRSPCKDQQSSLCPPDRKDKLLLYVIISLYPNKWFYSLLQMINL